VLVVPVYNMILLPDAVIYFSLQQLRKSSLSRNVSVNEKAVLIISKDNVKVNELSEDSFYPIGVVGVVSDIIKKAMSQSVSSIVSIWKISSSIRIIRSVYRFPEEMIYRISIRS